MSERLETARLVGLPAAPGLEELTLDFYRRNRAFLAPFEPMREESFYTLEHQRTLLEERETERLAGRAYPFWLFLREEPERAVGYIALNNLIRGAFQSCFLGYKMDHALGGQGYMTEAVRACTALAFETLGLHRIEATVMPRNVRSLRVLEKCGFQSEGVSRSYLQINGRWEDHVHMVLLAPEKIFSEKRRISMGKSVYSI